MSQEIDSQHVHIFYRLLRLQACVKLRDHADENQWHRQGSYAQNYSAVQGPAGGKLLLTLSATNNFYKKRAKSCLP